MRWSAARPAKPTGSATTSRSGWSRPSRWPERCDLSFCPRGKKAKSANVARSDGRRAITSATKSGRRANGGDRRVRTVAMSATERNAVTALRRGFLRPLPELRTGQAVSRVPESRRPLRRSAARICIIIAPTTRPPISTSSSSATLSVPLVLAVEVAFAPSYWVHLALWLPLTLGLSFGLMQPIKGAIVAWQWAHRMHGFDPESDAG